MISDRYDWLVVQLDEIAEVARKVGVAVVGGDAADPDELVDLDEQTDGLLEDAFEHSRIAMIDSRTAAQILRPPARIRAYAQLLAHKSQLVHALGRPELGHRLARRALELQLEAAALESDPDKIDHAGIDTLLDRDPPLELGPRHAAILATVEGRQGDLDPDR